jgi:hypothetical protein
LQNNSAERAAATNKNFLDLRRLRTALPRSVPDSMGVRLSDIDQSHVCRMRFWQNQRRQMSNLLSSAVSASAGENRCNEKKGTHSIAPEPGAFSFLLLEVEWLARTVQLNTRLLFRCRFDGGNFASLNFDLFESRV